MPTDNHSQPVYVRLPEKLLQELDELIQGRPGSRSDHIRAAVQEYVDRLRKGNGEHQPAPAPNK